MSKSRKDDPFRDTDEKLDKRSLNKRNRKTKKDILRQITSITDLETLDQDDLFAD